MPIAIIFILAKIAMLISIVVHNMREENRKRMEKERFSPYISDFSVSQYLERIEQDNIQILQEREQKPQYHLILWIGLDGLQMNDDKTFEWIRRKEKKAQEELPARNTCDTFPQQTCSVFPPLYPTYNAMRMIELQMQIQNTCIQHQMALANQQIINSIHPMCTQFPFPYYNYETQYCAKLPF